ncbi:MAG: hypothetical protein M1815_002381 [Lichina confinis]|nr:MAG: hypothetical protein M1815_002381 [Lichina confinis]
MTVALRSPDLVESLIAVDNAPVDAALSNDFAKYIMGMREIETRQVSKQIEADAILQRYEPGQYLRFRIPLNTLAGALDHMADFPYRDPDDGSSVRPYKGAALFVRGSESRYVPDDVLPVVGRFFPLFKVVDVKAGHWVISQNPVDFRRAVVDFLLHDR